MNISVSRSAASAAGSLRIFFVVSIVNLVLGAMLTVATLEDVGTRSAACIPAIALLVLVFRASEAFQRVPDGEGSIDLALGAAFRNLQLYFLLSILLALVTGVGVAVGGT